MSDESKGWVLLLIWLVAGIMGLGFKLSGGEASDAMVVGTLLSFSTLGIALLLIGFHYQDGNYGVVAIGGMMAVWLCLGGYGVGHLIDGPNPASTPPTVCMDDVQLTTNPTN